MKITFLGAGQFGTALAKIAETNGHETKFYDPIRYPDRTLADAVNGSDVTVYVAPSQAYPEIIPSLPKNLPLICASKGFLSLKPYEDFLQFSAIGGAAFASDIIATLKNEDNIKEIALTASSPLSEQIFSSEHITIEYTDDTLGIMLCGALKNVYAIGAGMFVAQNDPDNHDLPLSYLENILPEFRDILLANGAKAETLKLSCGARDLALSCSHSSRNYEYGYQLILSEKDNSKSSGKTIEGINVLRSLKQYPEFVLPESADIFRDIERVICH